MSVYNSVSLSRKSQLVMVKSCLIIFDISSVSADVRFFVPNFRARVSQNPHNSNSEVHHRPPVRSADWVGTNPLIFW